MFIQLLHLSACLLEWKENITAINTSCVTLSGMDETHRNQIESLALSSDIQLESIVKITISEGIKIIGKETFKNFITLKEVNLPNTLVRIESKAFYNCSSLKSIELPDSIEIIGSNSFSLCISLVKINVPKNLTHLEEDAFNSCPILNSSIFESYKKHINLKGGICYFKDGVLEFHEVTAIWTIYVNNQMEKFGIEKKDVVKIIIKQYDFPHYVEVQSNVFESFMNLEQVEYPNSLRCFGDKAFANCAKLKSMIGDSVCVIEKSAFENCTSLVDVTLNGATSIGKNAFANCINLRSISLELLEPDKSSISFINCTSLEEVKYCGVKYDFSRFQIFDKCPKITSVQVKWEYNLSSSFCGFPLLHVLNEKCKYVGTPTQSPTASQTPSPSPSRTPSASRSPTATPSISPTGTLSLEEIELRKLKLMTILLSVFLSVFLLIVILVSAFIVYKVVYKKKFSENTRDSSLYESFDSNN